MKKKLILAILVFAGSFALFYSLRSTLGIEQKRYFKNEGEIFGTTYVIKYRHSIDVQPKIDSILKAYDESVSPYKPNSIISRINRNDTSAVLNKWMETLIVVGQEVAQATNGAFDVTVAPLVEAWGFSFKHKMEMNQHLVDSLKALVDYRKIRIENHRVRKDNPRMEIDCISMGDGYASDIIADYLENLGITDYLVEIGGEIRMKGMNESNKIWSVGVDKPVDQTEEQAATTSEPLQQVVHLTNTSLSTSGNYRNFYYKDGKKYAHTIDPKSGYPVQHSLLSATIVSQRCIVADAYSTACMVIGLEKSLELLKKHSEMEGYFIYTNARGELKVTYTSGFRKFLKD